jgi:hypothetical protein
MTTRLPGAARAQAADEKFTDYLLDPTRRPDLALTTAYRARRGYNVEVFDEDGETIDVFGARDADLERVCTDGSAAA